MDTRKLLEELENVIYDNLEIEYDYVTDLQNTCGSLIAPDVSFFEIGRAHV